MAPAFLAAFHKLCALLCCVVLLVFVLNKVFFFFTLTARSVGNWEDVPFHGQFSFIMSIQQGALSVN